MQKQKSKKAVNSLLVSLLCLSLLLCSGLGTLPTKALSKIGSRGSEVQQIQTKLIDWGYLSSSVDGIYGIKTRDAVKYFQRTNSLTVDGIAGKQTLEAMGIFSSGGGGGSGYSSSDYNLLARIISAESRGEPYSGQVAVGAVILNRVQHPSFPNSISGVIYQNGAFTCITDGQFNQPIINSAYNAAQDALNGLDPCGGAIYYYNPKTATSAWIRSRPMVKTIGNHVFCK